MEIYCHVPVFPYTNEAKQSRVHGIQTQLLERMLTVEQELKSQRELMTVRFAAVDRRFEDWKSSCPRSSGASRVGQNR
jgi:transcriptional regulator NrdR family protein